jgi:hypothetical protein
MQIGILLRKVSIELQPRDTRFNGDIHVGNAQSLDPIHFLNVDADSATDSDDATFDGRARSEGNNGHAVLRTNAHGPLDLVERCRLHHNIRRLRRVVSRILAMFKQDVDIDRDAIAQFTEKVIKAILQTGRVRHCFSRVISVDVHAI